MPVIRRVRDNQEQVKVLDIDASMQGTMLFKDPVNLRINGAFDGKLDTKGVLSIGEDAVVNADISGDDITIAGRVKGNITASKRLSIVDPAIVNGDIKAPVLSISEGAVLNGQCRMDQAVDWLGAGEKLMTLNEVAHYLEVDASLVEEWANQNAIPAVRENDTWMFRKEVVDNWVAKEKIDR